MPRLQLAVIALALVIAVGTSRAAPVSAAGARKACPVTLPDHAVPAGAGPGAAGFNYGSRYLRTNAWPRGRLPAGTLPGGGAFATVNPDGSIWAKQGWWRGLEEQLAITGRRLDATAPPLDADVPDGYGDRGFVATGLTFPTAGCWRVVGKLGSARLAYVVDVVKLKR